LTAADIGPAGALYVAGACLGALRFGQLTDRFGRRTSNCPVGERSRGVGHPAPE
jgi:hypothetical protein